MFFRLLLTVCLTVFLVACGGNEKYGPEILGLYDELDAEIENSARYDAEKEQRLENLRHRLSRANSDADRFELTNKIVAEYEAYNSDSALYYLQLNFANPLVRVMPNERLALRVKEADLMSHAGILAAALELAKAIPADSLIPATKQSYFAMMYSLYQYLCEYNADSEQVGEYVAQRAKFADSVLATAPEGSVNHLLYGGAELNRRGRSDEAITMMHRHMTDNKVGTREYSMLAATLADIYDTIANAVEARRYRALSGISDVKGSIKENTSFRQIAMDRYHDGDLERANRYLKKSISDATFFSARMRNAQSTRVLPMVDEAYSTMQQSMARRLRIQATVTTVLAVILIMVVLLLLKQFRRVHSTNRQIVEANAELSDLSAKLKAAVAELAAKNAELKDSNRVKEQYAALFMQYSASAISNLQHYQQSLRVLCAQGSSKALLLKKIDSSEMVDNAIRDFYATFDEAVLSIYPAFVDKFNALLQPADRIELKPGELLNTELRVFALIRLGVDDSAKIAQFLRCSITTVYTYRSKMRKRALDPENFENEVKNIT